MATNPYEFLKQKEIIQILDGDTTCGEIAYDDPDFKDCFDSSRSISILMPRLSGQAICDISTRLGFPMQYEAESKISRRKYFEDMLDRFIQEDPVYSIKIDLKSILMSFYLKKSTNTIMKSSGQFCQQ